MSKNGVGNYLKTVAGAGLALSLAGALALATQTSTQAYAQDGSGSVLSSTSAGNGTPEESKEELEKKKAQLEAELKELEKTKAELEAPSKALELLNSNPNAYVGEEYLDEDSVFLLASNMIYEKVNKYREQAGLHPLTVETAKLDEAKDKSNRDVQALAKANNFDAMKHDSSEAKPGKYLFGTENLYAFMSNNEQNLVLTKAKNLADDAFAGWRNSAGHNDNFLLPFITSQSVAFSKQKNEAGNWWISGVWRGFHDPSEASNLGINADDLKNPASSKEAYGVDGSNLSYKQEHDAPVVDHKDYSEDSDKTKDPSKKPRNKQAGTPDVITTSSTTYEPAFENKPDTAELFRSKVDENATELERLNGDINTKNAELASVNEKLAKFNEAAEKQEEPRDNETETPKTSSPENKVEEASPGTEDPKSGTADKEGTGDKAKQEDPSTDKPKAENAREQDSKPEENTPPPAAQADPAKNEVTKLPEFSKPEFSEPAPSTSVDGLNLDFNKNKLPLNAGEVDSATLNLKRDKTNWLPENQKADGKNQGSLVSLNDSSSTNTPADNQSQKTADNKKQEKALPKTNDSSKAAQHASLAALGAALIAFAGRFLLGRKNEA